MSERLNVRNLLVLASSVEPALRSLTEKTYYETFCRRVGLTKGKFEVRDVQLLEQVLKLLAIAEQLHGAILQQQIARKPGLLPFPCSSTSKPASRGSVITGGGSWKRSKR
jgi:hypothetical protein